MHRKALFLSAVILIVLATVPTQAGQVVIGGSSLQSPPPFWEDSFWGITASTQIAFPFTVISGGPYYAEELEVAAYHYEGMAGSLANFSINLDNDGQPGQAIGNFYTAVITETAQVVRVEIIDDTILSSETLYWLVGQTPQGQVNWNLADNVFGTAALRVNMGDWDILPDRNVSAFAILGSPVPEPATFLFFALASLSLIRKRRIWAVC